MSSYGGFTASLDHMPKLTSKEKLALYRRMKSGDMEAREQLILCLVPMAIRWTQRRVDGPGDQMLSAAFSGIVDAVDHWNPKKGALTTIAVWHIRKYWQTEAVVTVSRAVRVPRISSKRDPNRGSKEQAAASISLSMASGAMYPVLDHRETSPQELAWQNVRQEAIRNAVMSIPDERQRQLMIRRLEGATLEEAGSELANEESFGVGVSKERARQLERAAKKFLAEALRKINASDLS